MAVSVLKKFAVSAVALAGLLLAISGCAGTYQPPGSSQFNPNIDYSSFTTDPRDGRTYRTVKIGNYTWMAENLKYETNNSLCYNNNASNCAKYGRLYDWDAAMTACPAGWRLPDTSHWNNLVKAAGGGSVASRKLMAVSGWKDDKGMVVASTDEFGFSAVPSGIYLENRFGFIGVGSIWWTASDDGNKANTIDMSSSDGIGSDKMDKINRFSVRCVEGEPVNHEYIALQKLVGVWTGSYTAGQGETGLTLSVHEESPTAFKATFNFYNLPGKTNAANGKYNMNVSYNLSTKKYVLKGYEWIEQPRDYGFADLEGTISGDVFSGNLSGYSYTFRVVKGAPKPEPIVVPEPVATPDPIPAQEETATAVPATPAATATAQNIDRRLVGGTWHPDCGDYYPMTFNEDGTVVFGHDGPKSKWHTKGNEIVITFSNGNTHTAEYSIDEDGYMSYADCLRWIKSQ